MTKSKRHTCETCNPGGSPTLWDATTTRDENCDEHLVWECRNCHSQMPRRTRKPSAREQARRDEIDALWAELQREIEADRKASR